MFLKELIKFSKQNWWIYLLLAIACIIIFITGKGDIIEILILFFSNLIANIFIMAAMGNYSENKNKIGAIFHFSSVIIFTIISIYSFIYKGQSQYIIWQICFILAAIKAITFYNLEKDLKILNPYLLGILNIVFLLIFMTLGGKEINILGYIFNFNVSVGSVLMALGFSFVTIGLVSTNDNFRYWMNYIGTFGIISGAGLGTYLSYKAGNLNGVDLGYFILTFTTFTYFTKLLPKYIKT